MTRRRSVTDEREVRIGLTPSGVSLEPQMDELRATIATRAGLAPDALATLRVPLRALHARLAAHEQTRLGRPLG